MYKIIIALSYNGIYFNGWQKQKNLLTIQNYIETIVSLIFGYNVKICCSGRTDKGVNSIEQIIDFNIKKKITIKFCINSIKYYLGTNIKILWVQNIHSHFNSRINSIIRNYRYIIYNKKNELLFLRKKILLINKYINFYKLRKISDKIIGMNNYKYFRTHNSNNKNTVRYVFDIKIFKYNEFIIFDITANSFLYNMIRIIIGFLLNKQFKKNITHENKFIIPSYGLYFIKSYYPKKFFLKYNKKYLYLY